MPKINLKTLAYNTIRSKIVTCQYTPGTFLNEEQLTTELSLSRTPVRDALGRLEQEGLLEIRPKCGILVRPLTLNDIDMIFEVRMMYEPYVLTHYGANLSVSALNEFYDIFKKWDPNKEIYRDKDSFYDLDYRFHALIMSACPNEFINRSYDTIQTQNERFPVHDRKCFEFPSGGDLQGAHGDRRTVPERRLGKSKRAAHLPP